MTFNTKLFLSTFVLIFLAELGDKTQLAAMAKSIEGRFTVFLAASLALVCSTLIAVLFGDALARVVPARWLQAAAGILFLIFGALMLYNVVFSRTSAAREVTGVGTFERFVTRVAMVFEEAAERDYRRLAAAADHEDVRRVLLALADEERTHQERLQQARSSATGETVFALATDGALPELRELLHDVADDQVRPLLAHAIDHEQATVRFYRALAQSARLPALRRTLHTLADEEEQHASMLRALEGYFT